MNSNNNLEVIDLIKDKVQSLLPLIIEYRHHLHQYPELSFQEEKTSLFIRKVLDSYSIAYSTGWAGHGIVALIHGNDTGKCVALRADMDALPITEANEVSYKSQHPGAMHACGHDVHMAALLGAAIVLQELRHLLRYSVKLIFQPGEEKLPGGASIMIKEGVLKNPEVMCIIGQHVFPSLQAGRLGWRKGLYMASADEIYITVKGKGGHAAMPVDVVDTVYVSAQIIQSLQQVISRKASPLIPSVLSFGKINSTGGATNVIPDEVKIEGTFRTMDEKWRYEAHQWIKKIASDTAVASGAQCETYIAEGYPVLINHVKLTEQLVPAMELYAGIQDIVEIPPRMTSEDFAFYSQHVPAFFYRLGTAAPDNRKSDPVHTPTFDIDDQALETGAGMMAWLAFTAMG